MQEQRSPTSRSSNSEAYGADSQLTQEEEDAITILPSHRTKVWSSGTPELVNLKQDSSQDKAQEPNRSVPLNFGPEGPKINAAIVNSICRVITQR